MESTSKNQWYVVDGSESFGPISSSRLVDLARTGKLHKSSLVKKSLEGKAVTADKIKGLEWPTEVPPALPVSSEKVSRTNDYKNLVFSKINSAKSYVMNRNVKPEKSVRQPVSNDDAPNKWVACGLAFFTGMLGLHRFYVRDMKLGWLYLCIFLVCLPFLPGVILTTVALFDLDMRKKLDFYHAVLFLLVSHALTTLYVVNLFETAKWLWTDDEDWATQYSYKERNMTSPSKVTACLFAFFGGCMGAHKFYIGEKQNGANIVAIHVIASVVFVLATAVSLYSGFPIFLWCPVVWLVVYLILELLSLIDIISYILCSRQKWEDNYGY